MRISRSIVSAAIAVAIVTAAPSHSAPESGAGVELTSASSFTGDDLNNPNSLWASTRFIPAYIPTPAVGRPSAVTTAISSREVGGALIGNGSDAGSDTGNGANGGVIGNGALEVRSRATVATPV